MYGVSGKNQLFRERLIATDDRGHEKQGIEDLAAPKRSRRVPVGHRVPVAEPSFLIMQKAAHPAESVDVFLTWLGAVEDQLGAARCVFASRRWNVHGKIAHATGDE